MMLFAVPTSGWAWVVRVTCFSVRPSGPRIGKLAEAGTAAGLPGPQLRTFQCDPVPYAGWSTAAPAPVGIRSPTSGSEPPWAAAGEPPGAFGAFGVPPATAETTSAEATAPAPAASSRMEVSERRAMFMNPFVRCARPRTGDGWAPL